MRSPALLLLAMLSACGGTQDRSETSPQSADPVVLQSHSIPIEVPAENRLPVPEVTLISAGYPPLTPRRYRFTQGTTQQAQLRLTTTVQMQGQTFEVPALTLGVSNLVLEVDSTGVARVESTLHRSEMEDGTIPAAAHSEIDALEGEACWSVTSPQGINWATGGSGEMCEDSPSTTSFVFPTEPIGAGAQWQVRVTEVSGLVSVMTYQLDLVEGSRVRISGTIEQSGTDIELNGVRVASYEGQGTAENYLDPSSGFSEGRSLVEGVVTNTDGSQVRVTVVTEIESERYE